jgi:hypothetical protein
MTHAIQQELKDVSTWTTNILAYVAKVILEKFVMLISMTVNLHLALMAVFALIVLDLMNVLVQMAGPVNDVNKK